MYGGHVERWEDPFANNMFFNNDQLDDEGRYISAAIPPPPPGVSPSLLYSSPNKLRQMQNQQVQIASDSPTKRGQSSSKLQPSPLRMEASGSNTGSQKENQPIRPEEFRQMEVPPKADPVVRLHDWYIGLQPTQQALSYYSGAKGIKKWIQIYGIRYRSEEDHDSNSNGKRRADDKGEPWHSSLISERISANLVKSKSGKIYELMGNFDEVSSCKRKKVSLHTAAKFRNGFPADWADIVCDEARSSKGQKPKSPSKRQNDVTHTLNNSTRESRSFPIIETESFPTAQSSSQRPKPRPSISGKQLPEPRAQPKARKKKSLFRDDEDSSESEYHPSSEGTKKKSRGNGESKRDGKRNLDSEDNFAEDSEGDDSLYEEVTSKANKNAKKSTKGKARRRQSKDVDMVSQDEGVSSRSPSPELNGQVSSLHQMENARSRKQGQERRTEQRIRSRKSEPMPAPREMNPPTSSPPPAAAENGKKAKPIPRELRNLSKTAFGRLTLVQNAIMEQLEQNRSERKKSGRQSLPLMRTNVPQTPVGQMGNDSNAITPRSSRRTRTPVKPWWEVQPPTKSKPKTQAKATEVKKPQLFNMNSSSCDEEEEEASYDNTFARTRPFERPSPEQNSLHNQAAIEISSDKSDEDKNGLAAVTEKDDQDLIEERQIEEHVDLQSSPSHGKGSAKRIGDDLIGPSQKRSRMDESERLAENVDKEVEEDHQMQDDQEQPDDLHYVEDVFDQLPEQPKENQQANEVEPLIERIEEQVELPRNSDDNPAANESVHDEDVNHQNVDLAQINEEPQIEALAADREEDEMLQDPIELADTSKESSESERSRSTISPTASDQNTNETTADPVDVPSPLDGDQERSERLSDECEKGEDVQTAAAEGMPNHQPSSERDELSEETDTLHNDDLADFDMRAFVNDNGNHTEVDVVVIDDSDEEQESSVPVATVIDEQKEDFENTDVRQEEEKEEEVAAEGKQHEGRERSTSDAEQELRTVIAQIIDEELTIPVEEELVKEGEAIIEGEAINLQSGTNAGLPSQTLEISTQNQPLISHIIDDDTIPVSEKDAMDVPSATLPVDEESEHTEKESVSISDAIPIQSDSEEDPIMVPEASKEKELKVDLPNAGTAENSTPEAIHTEPVALTETASLTVQQEGTPTNEKMYPQLSEREEQEVSVEFEAMQIVSKGGGLLLGIEDEDIAYNIEPIEAVEEPKLDTNEETYKRGEVNEVEQIASMHSVDVTSMPLQVDTSHSSNVGNDKVYNNMEAFDGDEITHKDPNQILIPSDKLAAPGSPAEDEEMDDDNESVVSLSEVYYFSD